MANKYFQFKQFTVHQGKSAMKVTTDSCLFGAWVAEREQNKSTSISDRILDIGTGTGLLSLMIAQKISGRIDAIEIDAAAAEQARENVAASPWSDRINIITGDIKDKQHFGERMFDTIISNPPFYENDLVSPDTLKNNARHDESLRLGDLLELISYYLRDDGTFYLLLPYKRMKDVIDGCLKNGLVLRHVTEVRQTPDHLPFRVMISGRHGGDSEYTKDEIVVAIESNIYSDRFKALLKDYYLYL